MGNQFNTVKLGTRVGRIEIKTFRTRRKEKRLKHGKNTFFSKYLFKTFLLFRIQKNQKLYLHAPETLGEQYLVNTRSLHFNKFTFKKLNGGR